MIPPCVFLSILQFGLQTQKLPNPILWESYSFHKFGPNFSASTYNKLPNPIFWESYSFLKFVLFASLDPIFWPNIVATPFQILRRLLFSLFLQRKCILSHCNFSGAILYLPFFIGPRCPWGPIYGSGCLSQTN